MSRRFTPSRLALASRRLQARIRQENAAAPAAHAPRLDLDAMVLAAQERLQAHIQAAALLESTRTALAFEGVRARMDSAINRRNARAEVLLKKMNVPEYWNWLGISMAFQQGTAASVKALVSTRGARK